MTSRFAPPPAIYGTLDTIESDEESIQGSPLLDTKPTFSVNGGSGQSDYSTIESGGKAQTSAPTHAAYSSVRNQNLNQDNYFYDQPYSRDAIPPTDGPSPPVHSSQSYIRTVLPHTPPITNAYTSQASSYPSSPSSAPMGPLAGPPEDPALAPSGVMESGVSHMPPELAPRLTKDLAMEAKMQSKSNVRSGLNFNDPKSRERPYSMLLRSSFENQPPELRRQSAPISSDDLGDDDDALPFEATTTHASQARPKSSVGLPSLSTGIVMSKSNFESYRKSLSTLDMLKRQDSTYESQKEDDESGEANELDESDPENQPSEKERRRQMAKARQEQDARMSVYRQRMSKIIGDGSIGPGPAPTLNKISGETVTIDNNTDGDDEDDDDIMEDIPLSILRAHGFPRSAKKSGLKDGSVSPGPHGGELPGSPGTRLNRQSMSPKPETIASGIIPPRSPSMGTLYTASLAPSRQNLIGSGAGPGRSQHLSSIFGDDEKQLNRGLVAEIAKEEEARRRRQSAPFGSYGRPRDRDGAQSAENLSILPTPHTQLQTMDTKLQMLIDMLSNGANGFPPSGNIYTPAHAQLMAPSHRPPSTYSMPTSMSGYTGSPQPLSGGSIYNYQQPNTYGGPYSGGPYSGGPYGTPYGGGPYEYASPRETSVSSEPATLPPQQQSTTSIVSHGKVNAQDTIRDEEDEEDEENDAEWNQLLSKRRNLRAQWQAHVELNAIRSSV